MKFIIEYLNENFCYSSIFIDNRYLRNLQYIDIENFKKKSFIKCDFILFLMNNVLLINTKQKEFRNKKLAAYLCCDEN